MGIVYGRKRNWRGREWEGEKPYWGRSHWDRLCSVLGKMERKRETAGGIWKAVAKSRLGGEERGINKDLEEFSS